MGKNVKIGTGSPLVLASGFLCMRDSGWKRLKGLFDSLPPAGHQARIIPIRNICRIPGSSHMTSRGLIKTRSFPAWVQHPTYLFIVQMDRWDLPRPPLLSVWWPCPLFRSLPQSLELILLWILSSSFRQESWGLSPLCRTVQWEGNDWLNKCKWLTVRENFC
jgi:hypothetical protein